MLVMQYDKWLTAALPVVPEAGILLCRHITEVIEFQHSKNYTKEILLSEQFVFLVQKVCFLKFSATQHC